MSSFRFRSQLAHGVAGVLAATLLGALASCAPGSAEPVKMNAGVTASAACRAAVGPVDRNAMIAARQHLFGSDNVDAKTGQVPADKVILSWFGVSSYAAALNGHVVLLDAFIQYRTERPGYVPTTVDELIALQPELIFLGHGHGDHGELVSQIAGATCARMVGTPENCAQFDAGVKSLYGADRSLQCLAVTDEGSAPGAQIVDVHALPNVCITAFRHVHSDAEPPDADRVPNPPLFLPDVEPVLMHPPGPPPYATVSGLSGNEGGSLFYQFRIKNFSLVWMDTVGPLKEKAPELFDLLRRLPATDVMVGAILGFNIFTNGFRDPAMYVEAIEPQVFVPNHHDFIAPDGAQANWQATFDRDLASIPESSRPELHWMVNPYDYVRPLVYDVTDARWAKTVASRPDGRCP